MNEQSPMRRDIHLKLILPSLTEATSGGWRSIKYSLFPPLGLATLAAYAPSDWKITLCDEHVQQFDGEDDPDLVAIQIYVTSARRSYEIADHYRRRGATVVLGGLHPTSVPFEALAHADALVLGPAEEAWPRFLRDFQAGRPRRLYKSRERTLENLPPIRRDLIDRRLYLVPNSVIVSRGCPHACDFCYKTSFFRGGKSFYTYTVDRVMEEIAPMPGRHTFFLDDNILGNRPFAEALFTAMAGCGKIWQGAATVASLRDETLLKKAVAAGLRSIFIGFESLNEEALRRRNKLHNRRSEYETVIKMLHDHGVMINGSFVFGLEQDDPGSFDATVEWAVRNSIETATFHLMTPYPGTPLFKRLENEGRIVHRDWDLYDTRHAVFRHPTMSTAQLESGYAGAYRRFYRWSSIARGCMGQEGLLKKLRHFAYTSAWKKFDPLWALLIHLRRISLATPSLETVLGRHGFGKSEKPALPGRTG